MEEFEAFKCITLFFHWRYTYYTRRYEMTADLEFIYWMNNKEWYRINPENNTFELTDKATERARRSFELYKEKQKNHKHEIETIGYRV